MTASPAPTVPRWPVWRTRPAGFVISGYWPYLTGPLIMIVAAPILGLLLMIVPAALFAPTSTLFLVVEYVGGILFVSPAFSWVVLIPAIPVSDFAARRGYAGWGIATLSGLTLGLVLYLLVGAPKTSGLEIFSVPVMGLVMGLLYWVQSDCSTRQQLESNFRSRPDDFLRLVRPHRPVS
jgi:hypothetical protein